MVHDNCRMAILLYVFICLLSFNIIHLWNLLYVDMPHEEPMIVTTPFVQTSLFIIGIGVVCFYYMKYLRGVMLIKSQRQ